MEKGDRYRLASRMPTRHGKLVGKHKHLKTRQFILTRVFVALKHELNSCTVGIPELNTAILGSRDDPFAVWRNSNREHKVLQVHAYLKQLKSN